jgi:hypothetical protein
MKKKLTVTEQKKVVGSFLGLAIAAIAATAAVFYVSVVTADKK